MPARRGMRSALAGTLAAPTRNNAPARPPRGGAGLSNRVPTSTEEPHPLNSVAPLATILNDVVTFGVGGAFLNLHRLFANDADQEIYQRAFVVVQWDFSSPRPAHFPFAFSPSSTGRRLFKMVRRLAIADTVRSNFGAMEAMSIFESVIAKSCASSAGSMVGLLYEGWLHLAFTFSPSSTRRRMASESVGVSGCFSAHLTIEALITGSARKPIRGVMPVRGRPMTFCA